jgi:3-hydroxybutyryl-CoA dehydrogenase
MKSDDITHVGVLGAGLMGHGIAQVFAAAGYRVNLFDVDPHTLAAAKGRIAENFEVFKTLGLAGPEDIGLCLDRITLSATIEDLCRNPQLIIEAISEDLALKRSMFSDVEQHVSSDTILSSNTSAISITAISEALKHRGRFLGTHFWNPPHVLPCVEVIRGGHTDEGIFETVYHLMERVGKVPVRVMQDVPGFIGNRLQHAMWREAVSLWEKGVASAEDIDKVVKSGFGLRMPFIGPLETADLAGLVLVHDVHQYLFPYLDASQSPSPALKKLIDQSTTGVKTGKGFYDWSGERIRQVISQRDQILLRIINEIIKPSTDGPSSADDIFSHTTGEGTGK